MKHENLRQTGTIDERSSEKRNNMNKTKKSSNEEENPYIRKRIENDLSHNESCSIRNRRYWMKQNNEKEIIDIISETRP